MYCIVYSVVLALLMIIPSQELRRYVCGHIKLSTRTHHWTQQYMMEGKSTNIGPSPSSISSSNPSPNSTSTSLPPGEFEWLWQGDWGRMDWGGEV